MVSTEQPGQAKEPLRRQIRSSASNAWKIAVTGLKLAANFVMSPVHAAVRCAISSYWQIHVIWRLRKPILIALGVSVASDADWMEQTLQSIDDTWADIQQGDFFPNPSPAHCASCPFQETRRTW